MAYILKYPVLYALWSVRLNTPLISGDFVAIGTSLTNTKVYSC